MKALILAADGFEDMELFYPYYRLKVDSNLITSRCPDDLPAFMGKVLTSAHLRHSEPAEAAVGAAQQP